MGTGQSRPREAPHAGRGSSWSCFCVSGTEGFEGGTGSRGESTKAAASSDASLRARPLVGASSGVHLQQHPQHHPQQQQQHRYSLRGGITTAAPADSAALPPADVLALAQHTVQQHFGQGAAAPAAAQQAVAALCSPPCGRVGATSTGRASSAATAHTTTCQVLLPALDTQEHPGCFASPDAAHMLSRSSCSSAGAVHLVLPSSPPDHEPASPAPRAVLAQGAAQQQHQRRNKLMGATDEAEAEALITCTACGTAAASAVQSPASGPCPQHDAAAASLGGVARKLAAASSSSAACSCELNALIKAAAGRRGGGARPHGSLGAAGTGQGASDGEGGHLRPGEEEEEDEDEQAPAFAAAVPAVDPVTAACVCLVHSQGRPTAGSTAAAGTGAALGSMSVGGPMAAARSAFASAWMGAGGGAGHGRSSGHAAAASSSTGGVCGVSVAASPADPQLGLSQLPRTVVHWLTCEMGYGAYGSPPTTQRLLEAQCSMYLCAAFCQVVALMLSHAASHPHPHGPAHRHPAPLSSSADAAARAAAPGPGGDVWSCVQRALRHVVHGAALEQPPPQQQQQQQQQQARGRRSMGGDEHAQLALGQGFDVTDLDSDGTESDLEHEEDEEEAAATWSRTGALRRRRQAAGGELCSAALAALREPRLVHQVTACTYALVAGRAAAPGGAGGGAAPLPPFPLVHHHDALPPSAAGPALRTLALKTATATELLQRLAACAERRRLARAAQEQRGEEPLIMYVCGHGDTLLSVAAAAGVPVGAVVELNGLHSDPCLRPGDCVALPVASVLPRLHCTQPNESLCGVACQYAVTLSRLLGANPRLIGLNPRAANPGWVVEVPLLHGHE